MSNFTLVAALLSSPSIKDLKTTTANSKKLRKDPRWNWTLHSSDEHCHISLTRRLKKIKKWTAATLKRTTSTPRQGWETPLGDTLSPSRARSNDPFCQLQESFQAETRSDNH